MDGLPLLTPSNSIVGGVQDELQLPHIDELDAEVDAAVSQRAALATYERTHLDVFENLYGDQIVITTEL